MPQINVYVGGCEDIHYKCARNSMAKAAAAVFVHVPVIGLRLFHVAFGKQYYCHHMPYPCVLYHA
jgi:hypothetical protein